jgi:hypothetical protein
MNFMFEDQTPQAGAPGSAPANLPTGEPEDMFAGTNDAVSTPSVSEPAPTAPPSAIGAGMLKPATPAVAASPSPHGAAGPIPPVSGPGPIEPNIGVPVTKPAMSAKLDKPMIDTMPAEMQQPISTVKEPSAAKKIMMLIIAIVVLLILVGIGWFVYASFFRSSTTVSSQPTNSGGSPLDVQNDPFFDPTVAPDVSNQPIIDDSGLSDDQVDDSILFGESAEGSGSIDTIVEESIDVDGDNLDNARELDVGTDPNNWDTDGDGLSDGDEVIIWKTDPLNPDSDGDTFLDGAEVKNGYNPAGEGRIFEPPSAT